MTDFLQARIDATKTQIVAYEEALTFFAANEGVTSYTINTGQDSQTVTRISPATAKKVIDSLYNQLAVLERRRNGGAFYGGAAW